MKKFNPGSVIGKTVYWVDENVFTFNYKLNEDIINEIILDEKYGFKFKLKKQNYSYYHTADELYYYFRFNKTKAQNVFDSLKLQKERYEKRRDKEKDIYCHNKELIKDEKYTSLIGKEILIKQENDKWIESKIIELSAGVKTKNQFFFFDEKCRNRYRFDREGKNWVWLTKEIKAQKEIEKLESKIKKIKESLKNEVDGK